LTITCSICDRSTRTVADRARQPRHERDLIADQTSQHRLDLTNHLAQVDSRRPERLATAEGEKLTGE
jgi:hypothetical protein